MFKEINTKDISINDYTSILQRKEYICDTEDDIEDLPKRDKIAWGSTAKVISSSNIYILNSQNEWVILSSGGSGGGSGSGSNGDIDNLVIVKTLPPLADADPNVTYARPMGNVNMYRFGCRYAAVSEGSLPADSSELVSSGIEWFIVNNYNGTDETKVFQYMAEGSGEIEETNMTIGSPEDDDTISYDTYHVQAVFCLFYASDAAGSGENSQYNMDNNFSEDFRGKIYDGYIPYWWES